MDSLQDKINAANQADKNFFDRAFEGNNVPANIRKLSERLCRSYGIKGICDPMYIANVIAVELGPVELGLGDGQSNFYPTSLKENTQ